MYTIISNPSDYFHPQGNISWRIFGDGDFNNRHLNSVDTSNCLFQTASKAKPSGIGMIKEYFDWVIVASLALSIAMYEGL
ncbi:MAG: hypothetical protein KGZ69_13755 [Methylomonas sp.]|nr:hypothetical protein [Methylomonas sp.]